MYDCGYEPTKEEIQMLLKSLKPGQKLPLVNDIGHLESYLSQLIDEDYLDRLQEGYTLRFVTNRLIGGMSSDPSLRMNKRLYSILSGIGDVTERRGLDLHFEWNFETGVLLHNYNPNFEKGCDCEEDIAHKSECEDEECEKCCCTCVKVYICRDIESGK